MKRIKLFESFSEIDIDSICAEFLIEDYTVNSDGTVDVDGDVCISAKRIDKLPLKFGKVSGNFICDWNYLTTLEGAPIEVGGNLICSWNKLTRLEGAPSRVGGNFFCSNNELISLKGSPKEVGGNFECYGNPIYFIYKLFPNHTSFMDSLDYNYLRRMDIIKFRFEEALDELGIEVPRIIKGGYTYI